MSKRQALDAAEHDEEIEELREEEYQRDLHRRVSLALRHGPLCAYLTREETERLLENHYGVD